MAALGWAAGGVAVLSWLAPGPWPLVPVTLVLALLGGWVWRRHAAQVRGDRSWRAEEARAEALRTLTSARIDAMSGVEFEELVADLCRRDGCTAVRRVGGSHDNGVDVTAVLPDGRSMIVQCKRYAPRSAISSGAVRELIGARDYAEADVALLVTTTRFSRPAEETARSRAVLMIPRDLLGAWVGGAKLGEVTRLPSTGGGDRLHRDRWRRTYGDRR